MDLRPIGFFDSGLGGVSVLREARRLLPRENYIYYGDNANAPYGDKTEAEITRLTLNSANELIAHDVKVLVIACNTATATCIRLVRQLMDVPVVSVEPAIKPACAQSGHGCVLMLATLTTTRLSRYLALQSRMPDPKRVINVPCPGLVDRIEQGVLSDDAFDDLLDGYLSPYWDREVDGIVLGCTHYPFIRGAVRRYASAHFTGPCSLYDGNMGTANELMRVLKRNNLVSTAGAGRVAFYTSGDPARCEPLFRHLMDLPHELD